ncbi:MAG TPA: questin oxidase family protein [Stellaceae bacterium]|nr:questin oxidase family protein [Stellaceae bacterium]
MRVPSYAPLDDALDRLSGYGTELVNGNFNHAPMVAEALCAMGRPQAVMPWIERYQARLVARAPAGKPVPAAEWRGALGNRDRFPAWSALLAAELRDHAWREVLDRWAGRLAPAISAAATHGVIRTGHAVRALMADETPQRVAELADALASWAASYRELPTAGGLGNGVLPPREAIARVAIVPPERRRPGNIVAALKGLDDFAEFAPSIGLVDLDGDIDRSIAELTELFARVYLSNARNGLTAIVFIHGVTSLAALGHIAPHVSEPTARLLVRYGWQAGCGLYACFGSGTAWAGEVAAGSQSLPESLVDRALAHGDEHVIKFTEACLCRDALAPSPAYSAAVANVLEMVGRR